jgi:hypothetical protein
MHYEKAPEHTTRLHPPPVSEEILWTGFAIGPMPYGKVFVLQVLF